MEKKLRCVYYVDNDELFMSDEVELPLQPGQATTNLKRAYECYSDFYCDDLQFIHDKSKPLFLSVNAREISVTDDEWEALKAKEVLEDEDYSPFVTATPTRAIDFYGIDEEGDDYCGGSVYKEFHRLEIEEEGDVERKERSVYWCYLSELELCYGEVISGNVVKSIRDLYGATDSRYDTTSWEKAYECYKQFDNEIHEGQIIEFGVNRIKVSDEKWNRLTEKELIGWTEFEYDKVGGQELVNKSIWKGKVEEENHVEEEIRRINEENCPQ